MKKLSIAIDMGAKNNGIFIVKSDGNKIVDKKATNIIVDNINFSKKSRRENRHKDRNYKRRKLAKRLLKELVDFSKFDEKQQELILGLLNNRGYTFLSTSSEFESLDDITVEFNKKYLVEISKYKTKEDFEEFFTDGFEDEKEIIEFLNNQIKKIDIEYKKKKTEFYKDFQKDHSSIKKELKILKDFFDTIQKEISTGSKPRKKYLKEIKDEINDFSFIENINDFFNLVGNISNLQLRVLRKFYNNNSSHTNRYKILKTYFVSHHYKTTKEKEQRKELFVELNKYDDFKKFLVSCEPNLTIPPYEDMNNRDTYKCNSMLIKPEVITDEIKETIDFLLSKPEFSNLLITNNEGIFEKEELLKTKIVTNNKKIEENFTYSKYLQRILDATQDITSRELNPRNVFKHQAKFDKGSIDTIECFKKVFTLKVYNSLKPIAQTYYKEEGKIYNGIYEQSTSILSKCSTNTPYKNNAKHILLKPIYSYNFSEDEADNFLENIKDTKGLQTALARISDEAKKYQNSFYHIIEACYNDEKCVDDKDIKSIVNNLDKNLLILKNILKDKDTYLNSIDCVTNENIKRVINIFKQTYEILFKELGGFNKTCKHCTKENSIRSDESLTIGKRLLSDVAKPIDGMLDMMLDRLAFEITQNVDDKDIDGIKNLEILLEQNRFEFEENLNTIKRANNSAIKKYKREYKDRLNIDICPYNGKAFEKGDYDHILPQSKGVYNSKANMIYCSVEGNQKIKGAKDWSLELIKQNATKHLIAIFKTEDLNEIKTIIKTGLSSVKKEEFTNFDNLKLHQQIAVRYGLFMKGTEEFNKAFEIVKIDKLKTITNGTQKRMARFIYEKLVQKFKNKFKDIEVDSKTIDNQLLRTARNFLANDKKELAKLEIQNSHSHCIDAMIVFYLANSKIKGRKDKQKENVDSIEPIYNFDDIYLNESNEIKIKKSTLKDRFSENKKINSIASTEVLFRENGVAVHYLNIFKNDEKFYYGETIKQKIKFIGFSSKILEYFKSNIILNEYSPNCFSINVNNLNNILFTNKLEVLNNFSKFKKIDELRYTTQKKAVINLLSSFLNPTSNDEKKFMESLIDIKKPDSIEHFTKENLTLFFQKGSKTSHKQITLKINKTWELLAKYLYTNKKQFLTQNIFKDKNILSLDIEKLKKVLKNSILFKKTHTTKRKITNEYSLPLKDVTDRMFILRRKDNNKKYIYQYVLANRENSTRSFFEDIFIHKHKSGELHSNIIPSDMTFYKKAFIKN